MQSRLTLTCQISRSVLLPRGSSLASGLHRGSCDASQHNHTSDKHQHLRSSRANAGELPDSGPGRIDKLNSRPARPPAVSPRSAAQSGLEAPPALLPGASSMPAHGEKATSGLLARPSKVWLSAPELTQHLQHSLSLQDMTASVTEYGSAMNAIHVSTALVRLVKLRGVLPAGGGLAPAAQGVMQRLLHMLVQPMAAGSPPRLQELDVRGLSSTLWAIVKGHSERSPAFHQLLARVSSLASTRGMNAWTAQHLSTVAYAIALAAERSSGGGDGGGSGASGGDGSSNGSSTAVSKQTAALFATIAAAWQADAGQRCNAQDVANLMWAFAKVGCLDAGLAQALCAQVSAMDLKSFAPQALSNILWACAAACCLSAGFADQLFTHISQQHLSLFKPQELSNILWAAARAGRLEPTFAQQLRNEVSTRDLATFDEQHLANILWACAKAGCLLPQFAWSLCEEMEARGLGTFKRKHLIMAVWACTTARCLRPAFARKLRDLGLTAVASLRGQPLRE